MNNQIALSVTALPAVLGNPSYMVTNRAGITFDSREPTWPLGGKLNAHVEGLRKLFGKDLLEGLNGALRDGVQRSAGGTFGLLVNTLRHYHRAMHPNGFVECWDASALRNYRAKLAAEYGNEVKLAILRTFLKRWNALRYPGVPDDVVDALKGMRIKNIEGGRAVRTQDQDNGALTPDELHNLMQDIYRAVEEERLTAEELSLAVFHIVTGRRAIQSANLKCKDVDNSRRGDSEPGQAEGEQLLLLHVPRVKQSGRDFRETRRSVHLDEVFFALFEAQRDNVHAQMRRLLKDHGLELQPQDLEHLLANLPLYPAWRSITATVLDAAELRELNHAQALASLRVHAEGQFWHTTTMQIGRRLQNICDIAGTLSTAGNPLKIGGTRLRYTKGTDLSRQGVGLDVLAWLMDHSDLQSASVYIDNLPEHAAEIGQAMAGSLVLNHVASMFRGELVDSEADAIGGDNPRQSRIVYRGVGAATCDARKQCGMGGGIPLACYTCDSFQPWLDAPHESVLEDLLQERDLDREVLGDKDPLTRSRDKTIVAVINVIQRCNLRKLELVAEKAAEGACA